MSTPYTEVHVQNTQPEFTPMSTHELLGVLLSSGVPELVGLEGRGTGLVATLAVGRETYRLQLDANATYLPVAEPQSLKAAA